MRTATDLLAAYAERHRDQRNIASHFIGVPMIVFAIGVLLARPAFAVGGLALSPAWLLLAAAAAWYLTRGELTLGAVVSVAAGMLLFFGHRVAYSGGVLVWLGSGLGVLLLGWTVQAIGRWYEEPDEAANDSREPVFADDLITLLVAPMFVAAEALFTLGWNRPLLTEIERRAGPSRLRDLARIA